MVGRTGRRSAAVSKPDPTAQSGAGSRVPRRSRLGSLALGAVGAAWTASGPLRWGAGVAVRTAEAAVSEVVSLASPRAVQPGAAERSTKSREATDRSGGVTGFIDRLVGVLSPVIDSIVRTALNDLDLTNVVLDGVDLDRVVAAVDLEAAVARVDLDAVVATVDLDAAVDRIDIARIIGNLDLDAIIGQVDLDRIVARLDIDAILERVDLNAVLGRVDLNAVLGRVDLNAVVAG